MSDKTTSTPSDNHSSTDNTTEQVVDNASEQQLTQVCCFVLLFASIIVYCFRNK